MSAACQTVGVWGGLANGHGVEHPCDAPMIDCLSRFDLSALRRSRTQALSGAVEVTHAQREKLAVAVAHGQVYEAAADAVTAACTCALARCAWPAELSVSVRAPGGIDPHLEDLTLGAHRASSAHGLTLASMTWSEHEELALVVSVRASGLQASEAARAGDVVVGFTANGLHEHGHAAALRATAGTGGPSPADLKRVFALQKSYLSVLHKPLHEGWYRHGRVPAGGVLLEELSEGLSEGLSLQGSATPWCPPDSLRWMSGFTGSEGIGLALYVPAQHVDALIQHVGAWGERAVVLARVGV